MIFSCFFNSVGRVDGMRKGAGETVKQLEGRAGCRSSKVSGYLPKELEKRECRPLATGRVLGLGSLGMELQSGCVMGTNPEQSER